MKPNLISELIFKCMFRLAPLHFAHSYETHNKRRVGFKQKVFSLQMKG